MKSLMVSTEFDHKEGKKEYYKVYVSRPDGAMVKGSRTLRSFTGSALKRVQAEMQAEIDRGAWK